jgi:hypothetical protein
MPAMPSWLYVAVTILVLLLILYLLGIRFHAN